MAMEFFFYFLFFSSPGIILVCAALSLPVNLLSTCRTFYQTETTFPDSKVPGFMNWIPKRKMYVDRSYKSDPAQAAERTITQL